MFNEVLQTDKLDMHQLIKEVEFKMIRLDERKEKVEEL